MFDSDIRPDIVFCSAITRVAAACYSHVVQETKSKKVKITVVNLQVAEGLQP